MSIQLYVAIENMFIKAIMQHLAL